MMFAMLRVQSRTRPDLRFSLARLANSDFACLIKPALAYKIQRSKCEFGLLRTAAANSSSVLASSTLNLASAAGNPGETTRLSPTVAVTCQEYTAPHRSGNGITHSVPVT